MHSYLIVINLPVCLLLDTKVSESVYFFMSSARNTEPGPGCLSAQFTYKSVSKYHALPSSARSTDQITLQITDSCSGLLSAQFTCNQIAFNTPAFCFTQIKNIIALCSELCSSGMSVRAVRSYASHWYHQYACLSVCCITQITYITAFCSEPCSSGMSVHAVH